MATIEQYGAALKQYYQQQFIQHELLCESISPGQLRDYCVTLVEQPLTPSDKNVLFTFFKSEKNIADLKIKIARFDLDKLKPITNFFKNKSVPGKVAPLNFIAFLLDYNPRPWSVFREQFDPETTLPFIYSEPDVLIPDGESDKDIHSGTKSDIIHPDKQVDVITSNVVHNDSTSGLLSGNSLIKYKKQFGIAALLFIGVFFFSFKDYLIPNKECMEWNGTQYIQVACETPTMGFANTNIRVPYDKAIAGLERIKISPETIFFDENNAPLIYYYKNNKKEFEYFSSNGHYPGTRIPLKKVTPYHIKKYIMPQQKQNSTLSLSDIHQNKNK